MINNYEEQEEFEMMYKYVMRNSQGLKSKDEIIEYLVNQCYYIDLHNDQLTETIDKIKSALGIKDDYNIKDLLPF